MKNQGIFRKLGDFVLGKGFYIVLFLCVATIGILGYYLIRTMTGQPEDSQQAGGDASVVLPDSEANGPDPAGTLLPDDLEQPDPSVQDTTVPQDVEQPDDPEPVKQPQETVQTEPPDAESAVYVWPVEGEILRDFSVESLSPDPTLGDWRTHAGLDIAAALDSQVLAMSAGTVSEVYEDGLMGTTVVLDHGNGLITTYCNLAFPRCPGRPDGGGGRDHRRSGRVRHRGEQSGAPPPFGGQPERPGCGPQGVSAAVRPGTVPPQWPSPPVFS